MIRKNDRYILLLFLMIVVCISIGYSVMNRILTISGNSEVKRNTWDLHFENIKVKDGSVVATKEPTIDNSNLSIDFNFMLNLPGDFYEFTVDVVNAGTIDAMIQSVSKTPELTDSQKKYINYIIEYQNGEQITMNQLVPFGEFVRLKVRVEYRSDVLESDIPTITETFNLGFTVNYIQADNNATSVVDNGVKKKIVNVVNGDGTQKSDEICLGKECFYVMYSDNDTITMLAKYNLHVGYSYYYSTGYVPLENPTGIQDQSAIAGAVAEPSEDNPYIGVIPFSDTNYWESYTNEYPSYVYNENSNAYQYVENYKTYLERLGVVINEARLISSDELVDKLGCNKYAMVCSGLEEWITSTVYWAGSAYSMDNIWRVPANSVYDSNSYTYNSLGVRPVIVMPKSMLEI